MKCINTYEYLYFNFKFDRFIDSLIPKQDCIFLIFLFLQYAFKSDLFQILPCKLKLTKFLTKNSVKILTTLIIISKYIYIYCISAYYKLNSDSQYNTYTDKQTINKAFEIWITDIPQKPTTQTHRTWECLSCQSLVSNLR